MRFKRDSFKLVVAMKTCFENIKLRNHEVRIRRAVLFSFFLLFCTLSPPPTSLAREFSPLLDSPKPTTQNCDSEQQGPAQPGEVPTVEYVSDPSQSEPDIQKCDSEQQGPPQPGELPEVIYHNNESR